MVIIRKSEIETELKVFLANVKVRLGDQTEITDYELIFNDDLVSLRISYKVPSEDFTRVINVSMA